MAEERVRCGGTPNNPGITGQAGGRDRDLEIIYCSGCPDCAPTSAECDHIHCGNVLCKCYCHSPAIEGTVTTTGNRPTSVAHCAYCSATENMIELNKEQVCPDCAVKMYDKNSAATETARCPQCGGKQDDPAPQYGDDPNDVVAVCGSTFHITGQPPSPPVPAGELELPEGFVKFVMSRAIKSTPVSSGPVVWEGHAEHICRAVLAEAIEQGIVIPACFAKNFSNDYLQVSRELSALRERVEKAVKEIERFKGNSQNFLQDEMEMGYQTACDDALEQLHRALHPEDDQKEKS